jgi:OmpA-OmpF porin, OOP family
MCEILKRSAGGFAAVAILLSIASCAVTAPEPIQGPAQACSWETAQAASQRPAVSSDTVVLVDITASFWPKAGQQPTLPDDPVSTAVNALLRNFATAGTRLVSFGTFDGSSATIDWKLAGTALPTPTGDSGLIQSEQQNADSCLTTMVKSAIAAAPQAPGTDVLAALAAAGQQLQGTTPGQDHVVVITDGLSNTGCLSLSNVISEGKPASTVLGTCPERADLNLLHGVGLQLVGIGEQATQPPLNSAEQAWLDDYWGDLCTALHVASEATCVAPATPSAVRVSAAVHLADPAIKWPTISKGTKNVPVPADLLFAFNSSQLRSPGQAYLNILIDELKADHRTIAKVIGHTDAVGTSSYNLTLSQRRAQAVSSYLAEHGFPHVTAIGVGEADPVCTPQFNAAGAPIQSCTRKNRRVQIVLGG